MSATDEPTHDQPAATPVVCSRCGLTFPPRTIEHGQIRPEKHREEGGGLCPGNYLPPRT